MGGSHGADQELTGVKGVVDHDTPAPSEFDISKEEIGGAASLPSTPINEEKESDADADIPSMRQPRVDDWDGPDDAENPHNWSMWSRAYHAAVPALFGFAV